MSIFKNEKDPLLKRAKELGLNLDRNMSIFDMKSEIAKKEKELNPPPAHQPSFERGEY